MASAPPTTAPGPPRTRRGRWFAGGAEGNELLTVLAGAALIVLLAAIGITILRIGPLLWEHMFVGLVLLGPIALKLVSTGYRFVRYYTGNRRYRARGAPPAPLRLLAPLVVVSTVVVMASGVALLFAGPGWRGSLLPIHKASFFVWLAATALHVLGHLPELWNGLNADYGSTARLHGAPAGRAGRALSLAGALTLGVVAAIVLLPQFGPWMHAHLHHR